MKPVVVVAAALALASCQPSTTPSRTPAVEEAVVVHVSDGDTLDLTIAGARTRVRLLGVDAPEVAHDGQPAACGGDEAQRRLRQLAPAGAHVTLTSDPAADRVDRYGRRLGYVAVGGVDLGERMIREGWASAWHPASEPEPARGRLYREAQQSAHTAHTGGWASCDQLGRG